MAQPDDDTVIDDRDLFNCRRQAGVVIALIVIVAAAITYVIFGTDLLTGMR